MPPQSLAGNVPVILLLLLAWVYLTGVPVRAGDVPPLLRIGLDGVAMSADPHRQNSADSRNLAFHVFEPLIMPDLALGTVPWLATEWRPVGERDWVFTLRPNVRFHDGKPLAPEDVAFTFCRLDSNGGSMSGLIAGVERVAARDAGSVQITTQGPNPLLPQLLTMISIIPAPNGWKEPYVPGGCANMAAALTSLGEDRFANGLVPGTGPYRLTAFTSGGPAELARTDGYWGTQPYWEQVRLLPIPGGAARARALVAGDVDIINQVVPESLEFLAGRRDLRVVDSRPLRTLILTPNPIGPLADPAVRRALAMAIDRVSLARRVAQGSAEPAAQLAPVGILGHEPRAAIGFDQINARHILEKSGVSGGRTLRLITVEPFARVAEGIARYLLAVGVTLDIRFVAVGNVLPAMQSLDYDLFLSGWIAFTGELGYTGRELLHSRDPARKTGNQNFVGYSNPEIDRLLSLAAMESDRGKRGLLLGEMAMIASRDMPVIPTIHLARRWAMNAEIRFDGRVDGNTLATLITPASARTQ
ncbi:hypothetical protein CHU95_18875 [Niveispirillum lacus]|uniref:Solute-binding protein family 5 domain-containing protein n=1 Tax=Niveispirillum lacus TaxID=1981099 RepID=A0A255YUD1_9PROT|nr:hypothetical protein CHU95_18875 [Niveispirillum lacus]